MERCVGWFQRMARISMFRQHICFTHIWHILTHLWHFHYFGDIARSLRSECWRVTTSRSILQHHFSATCPPAKTYILTHWRQLGNMWRKSGHIFYTYYTYLGIFLHISMNIFCCFLNTWKSGPWSCGGRQAWSSGAVSSKNIQKYPKIVCVCYSSRIWQKKWNTSSARYNEIFFTTRFHPS